MAERKGGDFLEWDLGHGHLQECQPDTGDGARKWQSSVTKLRPESREEERARDCLRGLWEQRQEPAQESKDEALRPEAGRAARGTARRLEGRGGNGLVDLQSSKQQASQKTTGLRYCPVTGKRELSAVGSREERAQSAGTVISDGTRL